MFGIREVVDPKERRRLWEALQPQECLFDLWSVRECFARRFGSEPHFLVAERDGTAGGLLALSRTADGGAFACYPGETWRGESWLEQNRVPAESLSVAEALLARAPGTTYLRCLAAGELPSDRVRPDETDYVFFPERCGFDFEAYILTLSARTRRQIAEETGRLEAAGVEFLRDRFADLEALFGMNLASFGEASYFRDPRFQASFEDLADVLRSSGMLRLTTVLVGGRVAAVDIGGVFRDGYTLLAGGTAPEFPGVAKLINLHHIRRACAERLRFADFLSGDFGWKERFRLTRRPRFRVDIPVRPSAAIGE